MSWKTKILLLLTLFFTYQCSSPNKPFKKYKKISENKWETYFKRIGIEDPDLSQHVFLITFTTSCPPCLKEISWWNNHINDFKNTKITLIVAEKYQNAYNTFLKANEIKLDSHQDMHFWVLKNELIPFTPVKLFFNTQSELKLMEGIGISGNLGQFLYKIQK